MKWRVRKPYTRYKALHKWHKWFAWHPVRVPTSGRMSGQTMVWLSNIKRKGTAVGWIDYTHWVWEYKEGK